jgi:hypothetical protein
MSPAEATVQAPVAWQVLLFVSGAFFGSMSTLVLWWRHERNTRGEL